MESDCEMYASSSVCVVKQEQRVNVRLGCEVAGLVCYAVLHSTRCRASIPRGSQVLQPSVPLC